MKNLAMNLFTDARGECRRHLHYLRSALQGLRPLLPMTKERYQSLNEAAIKELDQFIFRFTKLQDAMGMKLFPAVLGVLQETDKGLSMLDRLNRLEQLNLLDGAAEWESIRELRNRLTHEYPDDPEKNAVTINHGVTVAPRLEAILDKIDNELRGKGIFI